MNGTERFAAVLTEAAEVDARLSDPAFLVRGAREDIHALLDQAVSPAARLAAAVYRLSNQDPRRDASPHGRRDLLALAAARFGDRDLSRRISDVPVEGGPDVRWVVDWATGSSGELHRADRPLHTLTGHTGKVAAVAATVLGGRAVAVTGSTDRTVRIWDLVTRRQVGAPLTGHTSGITAVATCLVDGRTVAVTGGQDKTVQVWDLADGRRIGEPLTGHSGAVCAVATAMV
ncbi:WD40 repeat domain-containing protein, partial [Streptomyces sp. NPDC088178]